MTDVERFYCVGPVGSQMLSDPIGGYVRSGDYDALVTENCILEGTARLYEELRKEIDQGSESMTHEDALETIRWLIKQGNKP